MLQLQSISLVRFRNYLQQEFRFTENIVGICGANGAGKTNLLDAIYYLSFTKSYFSRPDSQNVYHGLAGMRIEGRYELNGESQQLACILRENNRKELLWNGEIYKRFSDHIGRLPCVMIAPDDVELIAGGSEGRRNFLDTLLSQLNRNYLAQLIDHNRILQQRNSFLKQAAEQGQLDEPLLGILDQQLAEKGVYLFQERKKFLETFLPLAGSIYTRIAGKDEGLSLQYESQLLTTDYPVLLKQSLKKDLALLRSSSGIHRDDLCFYIEQSLFKNEASQGQRKSLLFALRLAEWQTLKERKGFTPILLLDDVFEKLDEQRMFQLLQWVCADREGQVFITDTHPERLKSQLKDIQTNFQVIEL